MGMRIFRPYLLAALTLAAAVTAAPAQTVDAYSGPTGAISPPPASPPPWSGQSGGSGDPSMSADAIRAAAADFHNCLERLWPLAARKGISRQVYSAYYRRADARSAHHGSARQPARVHQIGLGLSRHPGHRRPHRAGSALLEKYRATFDAAERDYGVDRYTIAAIWGVETNYGTPIGDRPVIRSTATLACIGRRQKYFRDEFFAALADPPARRHPARPAGRLLGRRLRADAIHAHRVQALRGRFRPRRPPRRRRTRCRTSSPRPPTT